MKKLLILLSFIITVYAQSSYSIKYKGITLGKIDTLSTLKDNYLKARVTNGIVRLLLGKKYYVFYDGNQPKSEDTKFRSDNKKILFALKTAIKERPTNEKFIIDSKRYITLKCNQNLCKFDYYTSGKHKATGDIEFLQNGEFFRLKEKKSSLEIVKN